MYSGEVVCDWVKQRYRCARKTAFLKLSVEIECWIADSRRFVLIIFSSRRREGRSLNIILFLNCDFVICQVRSNGHSDSTMRCQISTTEQHMSEFLLELLENLDEICKRSEPVSQILLDTIHTISASLSRNRLCALYEFRIHSLIPAITCIH